MSKKEFGLTAFFAAAAVAIFALMPSQTSGKPYNTSVKSGLITTPRTIPSLCAWLILILALIWLVRLIRLGMASKKLNGYFFTPKKEEEKGEIFNCVLFTGAMVIYYFAMRPLGFVLDSILLGLFLSLYLRAKWWQVIVSGVVFPIGLYYAFQLVYVNMPKGTIW